MFKFTTQRTAAVTRDMTDRSWTLEAVDTERDVLVGAYTMGPVRTARGERWLTVHGTLGLVVAADGDLVGSYDDLEAALVAAEGDARGRFHGVRDHRAERAMPEPDALAAMGAEFASAYRETYEALLEDDEAARAERRAGA